MLVLMLEVQKGTGVMLLLILAFRIISVIQTIHFSEQLPDQRCWITEDALYQPIHEIETTFNTNEKGDTDDSN